MARPGLLCAATALGALLLAAPSGAAEPGDGPEPFPLPRTLAAFALGADIELAAPGSPWVPLIYALYWDGSEEDDPLSLFAELNTSTLELRFQQNLSHPLFAAVQGLGTFTSHNAASYAYEEGRFSAARSFLQSFAGLRLEIGARLAQHLRCRTFAGAHRFWLSKYEGASALHPPPDHTQLSAGLDVRYRDVRWFDTLARKEGLLLEAGGLFAHRDRSGSWGEAPGAFPRWRRARQWGRLRFRGGLYVLPFGGANLLFDLRAGAVLDADPLTAVRAGSTVGDVPLAGAAYGELPMDRYLFLRAELSFDLWDRGRLALGLDAGGYRDLARRERGAAGFYVSLTWRTPLAGMPLCLTYGACPTAERPGGAGGHELSLTARAAFF